MVQEILLSKKIDNHARLVWPKTVNSKALLQAIETNPTSCTGNRRQALLGVMDDWDS